MIFLVLGGVLVAFGIVDLIGSFAGFDLWGSLGITLPEVIWTFSAYAEIAIGGFLFRLGLAKQQEPPGEEAETDQA